MRKILLSLVIILALGTVAARATSSYFTDTETSTGNTFAAGSLDLKVDDKDGNVLKFNIANLTPVSSQPNETWRLKNTGSINGKLDISKISLTSNGGLPLEPELEVDPNNEGDLDEELDMRLMIDKNCNGWYENTDSIIFNFGSPKDLASSYDLSLPIDAGKEVCFNMLVNTGGMTNKSQGDSLGLDFEFNLKQANDNN